jgi:hypothetical protein
VSRRVNLPSDRDARAVFDALVEEAATSGTKPTVVQLATRLGLTNSTFWRHFPHLATDLRAVARTSAGQPTSRTMDRYTELEHRNAELTRDNRQLTEHLDLALINIQRLTLDNHRLRQALEDATKVTRINTKSRNP